jgi:glycogen debranching enzyme
MAEGVSRAVRELPEFLTGFEQHLSQSCIGTISEIFDGEEPYTPRGCVAQAWSVAEVLRSLVKCATKSTEPTTRAPG